MLEVVGVRHHSPACARLVEERLRALRPAWVLIEGGADMNERLDELLLPHQLPIAIFSFAHGEDDVSTRCWAPFCDYSPEWRALQVGHELGAQIRFMDLPGYTRAFVGKDNRYGDHDRFLADSVALLCQRFHVDGPDALWDHLFELPLASEQLRERLDEYFRQLRQDDPGDDQEREDFMASCIAWAMAQGGNVVAVCGGYHKPFLEEAWQGRPPLWPDLPALEGRRGSYLVPYSFRRLDSFVGYQSGMPSPAYYQKVWEEGMERGGAELLRLVCQRLRERRQTLSSADLIAAHTMSGALMRLRGHCALARSDLLDGLAAALLKEVQDQPLPWTRRGPLPAGTDPLLVEIVAALSGTREGQLAAATPRPPLLQDAARELERVEITLPQPALALPLEQPAPREQSKVLHRFAILGIPGFQRQQGPSWATAADLTEVWKLGRWSDAETALIEASQYGGTLESAALGCLESLELAGDCVALTGVLRQAIFAGLAGLSERLLARLSGAVAHEPALARTGFALGQLLDLYRYDRILDSPQSAALAQLLTLLYERSLWLLETLAGGTSPEDPAFLAALRAMRDTLLHAGPALGLDRAGSCATMERKCGDPQAPPAVRGAALGFLWSLAGRHDRAIDVLRANALPAILGDFLCGLFALARDQVGRSPEVVAALDQVVRELDEHDFLVALPALRLAFQYFPPRELDQLARQILSLRDLDPSRVHELRRKLQASAQETAGGVLLQGRVTRLRQRFGLHP